MFNKPIDIVYTWVDGNDKEWQKEKSFWQQKLGIEGDNANDCRFIDNQELKYSLRSIAKYAPWINHIFIITNGQIPTWLDTNHPKITIVNHKEIMPEEALPTFNSEAIETCIANIPNLSEHFLYANDDCFINKATTPDFFFDKYGKPIIRMNKYYWSPNMKKEIIYCTNVEYCQKLINKNFNLNYHNIECCHNIMPLRKSSFIRCKQTFLQEFNETTNNKFRKENSIQNIIISLWEIAVNKSKLIIDRNEKYYKKNAKTAYFTLTNANDLKQKICKYAPTLFCINDDEYTNPENRIKLKSLLWELFPKPQPWEKPKDYQIKPAFDDKNSINIVFCPDNFYTKYFGVLLQSIIDNSKPDKNYDLLIFETDISENNKKLLLKMIPSNFSLRFVNVTEYIYENFGDLNFSARNHWSIATFYRLFIPFIMKNYKKVLYLDSDMCTNHNIDELFEIDMDTAELLAVKDTVSPILNKYKERKNYMQKILGLKEPEQYFNAGCVLFNLKNIEIEDYKTKLLNAFEINDLWFLDQDIMNMIFEGKTKLIHNKWNYIWGSCLWTPHYISQIITDATYKKMFIEAKTEPYIIHYTTSKKPWNTVGVEHADIFWHYARKTPFYEEILFNNIKKASLPKNNKMDYHFLERILSIKNRGQHKVLTILGIRFKIRRK